MEEPSNKKTVSSLSADPGNIHTVEKVLRKRLVRGKVHYLLKWVGFSKKHNSWEPEENVVGNVLIEKFNSKLNDTGRNSVRLVTDNPSKEVKLKAKSIMGSILLEGEQMFFVELENGIKPGLFTARLANQLFPQLVINYYESIAEKTY